MSCDNINIRHVGKQTTGTHGWVEGEGVWWGGEGKGRSRGCMDLLPVLWVIHLG